MGKKDKKNEIKIEKRGRKIKIKNNIKQVGKASQRDKKRIISKRERKKIKKQESQLLV